jgi:outer membrane protein OmpA-like peptidoglycan-associated protein
VFAQVDLARARPDVARTKDESPQAWSKAEGLRAKAEEALARGDRASAELLAEAAIAAYAHAAATARRLAAAGRHERELDRFARATERLDADERSREEIDREADRLEAELAVRREALAPVASGPADAKRQAARWVAARSNLAAAGTLCEAAYVLAPQAKGVAEARRVASELEARAKNGQGDAPIDASTRARALCLGALTAARNVVVNGGGPSGDALATDIDALGLPAARDERGVVATLPQGTASAPFEDAKLAAAGRAKLEALGKLAKKYPQFAIVVVVHAAPGATNASRDAQRAAAAKLALSAAGADGARIAVQTPGSALPAYDPADAKLRAKNERLEIVFVGPR